MICPQILYRMLPNIHQEMSHSKSTNAIKPLAMMASIAVLLTLSLAPAFADSTNLPLAPTNLNAMPVSGNQISLTWNPPVNATQSGIIGYQIQRNGTILVNNTESTLTNYNDTSLLPGNVGQYQVAAWNADGLGLFSNGASAATVLSTNPTTGQAPANTTSPIYGGNWTKYVIIHHDDHNGTRFDNQTLSHFDRMHIGQFMHGKYNGTSIDQQNGTYYQINNSNSTANDFQHKWNEQMAQFKLGLMRDEQQHKNLHNGVKTWPNHALAGMGSNMQAAKSIDRHVFLEMMQSKISGTNKMFFSGITHGNQPDVWHKIPLIDWKKLTHS